VGEPISPRGAGGKVAPLGAVQYFLEERDTESSGVGVATLYGFTLADRY
jgi:hypothetical protein